MHGSVTGVTVDKDSKDVLPVSVLRSVAKVSVMLNGKMDAGNDWLTGGELDEKSSNCESSTLSTPPTADGWQRRTPPCSIP